MEYSTELARTTQGRRSGRSLAKVSFVLSIVALISIFALILQGASLTH